MARGRAAGLWIDVSIKEASPAPDFRACWTIFGCRICHIIWLWHRVSATEPLCGNMFLPQPRCCGNKRSVLGKKRCHRNGLWHFLPQHLPCGTICCWRPALWQRCFATDLAVGNLLTTIVRRLNATTTLPHNHNQMSRVWARPCYFRHSCILPHAERIGWKSFFSGSCSA